MMCIFVFHILAYKGFFSHFSIPDVFWENNFIFMNNTWITCIHWLISLNSFISASSLKFSVQPYCFSFPVSLLTPFITVPVSVAIHWGVFNILLVNALYLFQSFIFLINRWFYFFVMFVLLTGSTVFPMSLSCISLGLADTLVGNLYTLTTGKLCSRFNASGYIGEGRGVPLGGPLESLFWLLNQGLCTLFCHLPSPLYRQVLLWETHKVES